MQALLALRVARKSFAGTAVLNTLQLALQPRETVSLLGPSGCGKSTLLRIAAGLDTDFQGELRSPEGEVAFVFQEPRLMPWLTVEQNIGFSDDSHYDKAWVTQLIEEVGLTGFAQALPKALSGGMAQRVAIARGLYSRPQVLLLDEPLAALDAQLRERLRSELNELLRGLGITSVFVTHDQGEAMALGDRILVMEHGRVAQLASPRDIYQKPANAFVAGFVGNLNAFAVIEPSARGLKVCGGELPWHGTDLPSTLYCRPEHLRVMESEGHLHGRLLAQFFQGAQSRLLVDVGSPQPLLVDSSDSQLYAVGAPIALAIAPHMLFTLNA